MKRCFKSILDLVLNRIFFVTKITSTVCIGITLAINCNSGRARLGDNTFNNNMLYQQITLSQIAKKKTILMTVVFQDFAHLRTVTIGVHPTVDVGGLAVAETHTASEHRQSSVFQNMGTVLGILITPQKNTVSLKFRLYKHQTLYNRYRSFTSR